MSQREESISIMSDEQTLKLDCRIIVAKFKREDYDTFQTETSTSVYNKVMTMRSMSGEYKFKHRNQIQPLNCITKLSKQFHCTLLDSTEYSPKANLEQIDQLVHFGTKRIQNKQGQRSESGSHHSIKSNSHKTPPNQFFRQQIQLLESFSPNKITQNHYKRKQRRYLSHNFQVAIVEASPIRIEKFATKQIVVTQLVDQINEPIESRFSLVQLQNQQHQIIKKKKGKQLNQIIYQQHSNLPKSILKSRSCSSERQIKRNHSQDSQTNKKSSFYKKVTFEKNDHQHHNNKHQRIQYVQSIE